MAGEVPELMRALVIAAGAPTSREALEDAGDADVVIAADGGLDVAMALGLPVDLLIGDLDSVSEAALDAAQSAGIDTQVYPSDKDATDLELALDASMARGADSVTVLGGQGGRLDHLLANAQLLADARYSAAELSWLGNDAVVIVCRDHVDVHGEIGATLSLIPVAGEARGVTTSGLRWSLEDETLRVGSTRGVSNQFSRPVATVRLTSGVLLVVMPRASARPILTT